MNTSKNVSARDRLALAIAVGLLLMLALCIIPPHDSFGIGLGAPLPGARMPGARLTTGDELVQQLVERSSRGHGKCDTAHPRPEALIITCMDAMDTRRLFGDDHEKYDYVRLPGAILTESVIEAARMAAELHHVKAIIVLTHTNCSTKYLPAMRNVSRYAAVQRRLEEFRHSYELLNADKCLRKHGVATAWLELDHRTYRLAEMKRSSKTARERWAKSNGAMMMEGDKVIDRIVAHSGKNQIAACKKARSAPEAIVLTCIDPRINLRFLLGDDYEKYHVVRLPGSVIPDEAFSAVHMAADIHRVKAVIVLTHSECAAVALASAAPDPKWAVVQRQVQQLRNRYDLLARDLSLQQRNIEVAWLEVKLDTHRLTEIRRTNRASAKQRGK